MKRGDVRIERIGIDSYRLGEGPLWDSQEQALYWLDCYAPCVWRHVPGTDVFDRWPLPGDKAGCLVLRQGGGAIVTVDKGFYALDFDSGICEPICSPAGETDVNTRFNDGKVDRCGRLIAGSLDLAFAEPVGAFYRLDPDLSCTQLDRDMIIFNGPCWSPDDRIFYCADSERATVYAYDYDIKTGSVAGRRVFAKTDHLGGHPDGATVDADGFLWSALIFGGHVVRYAPDGEIDRMVKVPIEYVTSVAFGGPDLEILFVTSNSGPMSGRPAREPEAGGLFAIYGIGVRGLPEPRFAG